MNSSRIAQFLFDFAQYRIDGDSGDTVTLRVNYAANTYDIVSEKGSTDESFRREIKALAAHLLKRKHGVNFADKVSRLH